MPRGKKNVEELTQYIVKSNDLIRKGRYSLTLRQQKLILYCISKIKPNDHADTWYEMDLKRFAEICGLDIESGGFYYIGLKDDLRKLLERHFCVNDERKIQTLSWIGDLEMTEGSGTVRYRFNPFMQPYLFKLKARYTQYQFRYVIQLEQVMSIRLYEILRSNLMSNKSYFFEHEEVILSVDYLRDAMNVRSYPMFGDFNRFVLQKAMQDINAHSDIHLSMDFIKKGKKIDQIRFYVSTRIVEPDGDF